MPWAYELVLTQRLFLFLSLKIITTFPATVTWKTKTCFVRLIIRGGGCIFDRKGTPFIILSIEKWYPLQIKINITSLEILHAF